MSRKGAAVAGPVAGRWGVPQSPFDAFKLVVYRFGVAELAAETGMKAGTIYNKCDADSDSHHQPTLRDVIAATRLSGDHMILESLDRLFDRTGLELGPLTPVSDAALLELLCNVGTEQGQLFTAVHLALLDKRFSRAEYEAVRAEGFDLVRAVMAFVQRIEGMVDG